MEGGKWKGENGGEKEIRKKVEKGKRGKWKGENGGWRGRDRARDGRCERARWVRPGRAL